jgi:hypothetical protein
MVLEGRESAHTVDQRFHATISTASTFQTSKQGRNLYLMQRRMCVVAFMRKSKPHRRLDYEMHRLVANMQPTVDECIYLFRSRFAFLRRCFESTHKQPTQVTQRRQACSAAFPSADPASTQSSLTANQAKICSLQARAGRSRAMGSIGAATWFQSQTFARIGARTADHVCTPGAKFIPYATTDPTQEQA